MLYTGLLRFVRFSQILLTPGRASWQNGDIGYTLSGKTLHLDKLLQIYEGENLIIRGK